MSAVTEGKYPFEFVVGDQQDFQVEKLRIASGLTLDSGAILAKTFVGTISGALVAGATGDPSIGTLSVGAKAIAGQYEAIFTGATTFQVFGPYGEFLGTGATGTAFNLRDRIVFTITAGGTAAAAGDKFVITVVEGASTYKVATGSDAVAILAKAIDTTGGAALELAVVRNAEVHEDLLGYGSMNATAKALAVQALKRQNILVRGGF